MFRLKEIVRAVNGRALYGDPELGISGVSIDSRTIRSGQLFVAIKGSRFDGHDFIREAVKKGAKAIIGLAHSSQLTAHRNIPYIRVADTRRALGDLARFHRQRFDIPVIAITGSNGKTTTKDILAWILSSRVKVLKNEGTQNNDIGVPLTLLKLDNSCDAVVLELGTNHFGEIAYLSNIAQPNFGIITNVGPAHLENLRNLDGVFREKVSLLKNLIPPRIAVLNSDDSRLREIKSNKKIFIITYGMKNKSDFNAEDIKLSSRRNLEFSVRKNSNRFQKMRLNTVGYCNVYNALAAIVVSRLLGWNYRSISQRLWAFVFPPGRLKLVKLKGLTFIDDSYNANPVSLEEALSILGRFDVRGRRIFVMGDMLELGSLAKKLHRQIGVQVARICDTFISVGELSKLTAHQAYESGLNRDCVFSCENSVQARDLLFGIIKPCLQDLILVKGSRLMKMEEVLKVANSK